MRKMSMEAVEEFEKESLDFVFIDSNHSFDYVMEDLIEWSKRVRKGGIISGDDYFHFRKAGVIEAVDTYTRVHGIKFNLTDPYPDKIQDRGCQEQPVYWWVK
jgi:predicted O-methyltransferase YrrM